MLLLRKLRAIPKVKKVFIRSGIRFDYLMKDPSGEFFTDLVQHHISGLRERLHLPDHAAVAPAGDGPALMEGQGAEIAGPETPPVVGHRKAHLLNGGHAPHLVIHGVGCAYPRVEAPSFEEVSASKEAYARANMVEYQEHDAVSGNDEHAQPGAAQRREAVRAPPVRLGQDRHPAALRFQYPADDRRAKGGVVYIGVPRDEQALALHL